VKKSSGSRRGRASRARARVRLKVYGRLPRAVGSSERVRLRFERRGRSGPVWRTEADRRVRISGRSYRRRLRGGRLGKGRWRVSVVVIGADGNVLRRSRNRYFRV
jgi:hypothetical protein